MQTMQPVIVFGSYMLDDEHVPPDEFELRLHGIQTLIEENGWSGLLAYGDAVTSAFVTYATNYSPRNRPSLALIPSEGEPCLLVWASARDFKREAAFAWMDDVRMSGRLSASIGTWFSDVGIDSGTIALVGAGNMQLPVYDAVVESCTARRLETVDADQVVHGLLHRKRPRELVMMRRAAGILDKTVAALNDTWKLGASPTDAVLAAEGVAFANQAQDARTLFSLDGGRTLRPFERPLSDRPNRLAAYAAVRYQGYWAEGFVTLSKRSNRIQKAAEEALDRIIAAARPCTTGRDLAYAAALPDGFEAHAMIKDSLGHGIGLTLTEIPDFSPDQTDGMVEDGVYSLTVGLSDGRHNHALTSAMVVMGASEAEILWRAS